MWRAWEWWRRFVAGAICAKALQRSLLGASSGFWHSVPGRWLIGRVAGLAVILLLVFPVFYGVIYRRGAAVGLVAVHGRRGGRHVALMPVGLALYLATAVYRLAAAHARESDHRQEHAQAAPVVSQLRHGPRRIGRVRVDHGGMGEPVAAGHDFLRPQPA